MKHNKIQLQDSSFCSVHGDPKWMFVTQMWCHHLPVEWHSFKSSKKLLGSKPGPKHSDDPQTGVPTKCFIYLEKVIKFDARDISHYRISKAF